MKKIILTSATVLFIGLIAFAYENGKLTKKSHKENVQKENIKDGTARMEWNKSTSSRVMDLPKELKFDIRPKYSRPIKKEKLYNVKVLSDIISDYPINWITDYISVEISSTCDGKAMKAVSPDATLTEEQRTILNTVDLGADVILNVKYTYKVPVANTIEKNTMHVAMTVVPEVEAEYIGGDQAMRDYLTESVKKFSETTPKEFQKVRIKFTINEGGGVNDIQILDPSKDSNTYRLLLDAINNMPKWKPAENAKGEKVKQEFQLTVGNINGDGC